MLLAWESTAEGTINVNTGGTVSCGDVFVGGSFVAAGGKGILNVTGGLFDAAGTVRVYNTPNSKINLSGRTLEALALNLNGTPSLLNWTGGTLKITNSVTFDSAAAGTTTSAAFGSSLTLGSGMTLQGSNNLTLGGTGAFNLTVGSGGMVQATTVNVAALGTLAGSGTVLSNVQNGGLVTPGTSPGALHITGNYTQTSTGELRIELASDTSFDSLEATGQMVFAGKLTVTLGFSPLGGEVFDILDFSSVTTHFTVEDLPPLDPTMAWDTSELYTTGELSITLPGDFNLNNHVDAIDYVLWREQNGTPAQYTSWRANFGREVVEGSGGSTNYSSSAVPEPAAFAPVTMALILAVGQIRRRRTT